MGWSSLQKMLGLALPVCLLGACATSPMAVPSAAMPTVPPQWSQQPAGAQTGADPAALAQWWQAFADPALTGLVQQALHTHTSVRSAQAALQQARALQDVTDARSGPTVGASASAQRSKAGRAPAQNTYRAGLDVAWEPDVFGAIGAAQEASQAQTEAAQANLQGARVSLAAEVAATYIQWRDLEARLAIARSNLAAQLEVLQITQWRVQAGLVSELDLAQAQTLSAQTQAQLPLLQSSATQAVNSLAVLTGHVPGTWQGPPAAAGVPQPPAHWALAFPADTLRQRPDVRAAEQQTRAAWAQVAQADAARYPSFSLNGSLGWAAAQWGDLTSVAALTRSVLAGVSASVWDGGAAIAQVQAQQSAFDQARIRHEAVVMTALQEVEDALAALQADRERVERLQAAAASAQQASTMAQQRYASGLIDYATVLNTQKTQWAAQSEAAAAQATWSTDHVALYKALGGGWPGTPSP